MLFVAVTPYTNLQVFFLISNMMKPTYNLFWKSIPQFPAYILRFINMCLYTWKLEQHLETCFKLMIMLNCAPFIWERDYSKEKNAFHLELLSSAILPRSTTHLTDNSSLFITKKGVSCNSLSLRSLLEEMRLGLFVRNWRIQRIFKIRMKSRSFSLQTRRKNTHQSLLRNRIYCLPSSMRHVFDEPRYPMHAFQGLSWNWTQVHFKCWFLTYAYY